MVAVRSLASKELALPAALVLTLFTLLKLVLTVVTNLFFSPLGEFPGPRVAAVTTSYRAWIECIRQISWHDHLSVLHARYGPVVRVGPNELHFSEPQAYLDIYNNANRWDKEPTLYHSFNEDRSSFGFLTYKESKERKDVLGKSFSARAVVEGQSIVQGKIDELCSVLSDLAESTNNLISIDKAFRCVAIDVITYYCFGTSVDAIHAPEFRAPILTAMDASMTVFIWFRHSTLYRKMIMNCPRPLSRILSPAIAGMIDLQEILEAQIRNLTSRDGEKTLSLLPHRMTIYHSLLDKSNYTKSGQTPPSAESLYDEAQVLMFAGSETVGNTLMVAAFHLAQPSNEKHLKNLKEELYSVYPDPIQPLPPLTTLENLPNLNATIKEALRISNGVVSGLPRITPSPSPSQSQQPPVPVTIATHQIPSGTIVSIGSTFVHYNTTIFPNPTTFDPTRWLTQDNNNPKTPLETWLVAFSRGPRSCLGVNLAWLELRLTMVSVFRKFDLELTDDAPEVLKFRDAFTPLYDVDKVKFRVKKDKKVVHV